MPGRKPLPIRTKVTAMLATGTTQKAIAEALHINERTVRRIASAVRPELEEADRLTLHSQRVLKKILPASKRVASLKSLLDISLKTKQPASGLAVIQYADKLAGIITPLDRLKVEGNLHAAMAGRYGGEDASRPIFMLESGASIHVTVGHQIGGGDQPSSEVQLPVDPQEIIDVQPSSDPPAPLQSPRTGDDT